VKLEEHNTIEQEIMPQASIVQPPPNPRPLMLGSASRLPAIPRLFADLLRRTSL
jgi:hypothetical protein